MSPVAKYKRPRSRRIPGGVYVVSLGCPKNLVDTEVMTGNLLLQGYSLVFDPDEAEIFLVNTCAFLPSAREESASVIHDAQRWKRKNPGTFVVVAGCLIEQDKKRETIERFPQVDLWFGVDQAPRAAELFNKMRGGELAEQSVVHQNEPPHYLYDHQTPRMLLTMPHTAYLKIADGCDNRCSYCAIPNIRGSLRSRNYDSVLQEARNLIDGGVRELVLIAQDITAFGHDQNDGKPLLAKLLNDLDALDGDFRIRLLYTHPAHYTPELIDTLGNLKKLWPYLDIPLQHISDSILKRMGRKTTRSEIESLLDRLRRTMPDLTLRTTFITGFPGESEAEFQELKQFMEQQRFDRCGVFAYSAEPGTPAAQFEDQVAEPVARRRADELMELQQKIMGEANRRWIGKTIRVLIDYHEGHTAIGRGAQDAAEIDNQIQIPDGRRLQEGEFYEVVITGGGPFKLTGSIGGISCG